MDEKNGKKFPQNIINDTLKFYKKRKKKSESVYVGEEVLKREVQGGMKK